ncbi:MAG: hypothetical protein JWN26_364 [Candidatus Saccharibacteria bacterium]|nr:hypothetical protein [Candidatus Saccharibacteria bacterium]
MGKQKKKRNKAYTGVDATITRPIITRISASNRNKFAQWWFEYKRIMKPILIASGVVLVLIVLIVEIIRIANGG